MNIISHALLTAAGVSILSLDTNNMILAYVFGVGIDLDHLIKIVPYIRENGLARKRHYHWRTSLQEPVSLLWVVLLSIYLSSFVPVVFFLGHVILDYLMSYEKLPFYPFSNLKTRGIISKVEDEKKDQKIEIIIMVTLICLNLILKLIKV